MNIVRTFLLATVAAVAAPAWAQGNPCGDLESAYGPYDYRLERDGRLRIVERFHFSPQVEGLIRGDSGGVGDDLNYILMTSPNHHRALMATVRYGDKLKTAMPPGMHYSIDCYFERAIRFQPDDTVVRELFAQYLGKGGHPKEAIAQLQAASGYAKDNALSHYNIGLIYFELKDYDQARSQAWLATEQGLSATGLADKLKAVGKWQEPKPAAAAPATGAASGADAPAAPTVAAAASASAVTP